MGGVNCIQFFFGFLDFDRGVGGWGQLYPNFFWDFWIFFIFTRSLSYGYFAMQTALAVELDAGIDYSRDQSVQGYVK